MLLFKEVLSIREGLEKYYLKNCQIIKEKRAFVRKEIE